MHLFNQGLVSYVFYPVGVSYNFLVPETARTSIANCGHNLLFPVRLVNTCLQGKFQAAWEDTKRFGVIPRSASSASGLAAGACLATMKTSARPWVTTDSSASSSTCHFCTLLRPPTCSGAFWTCPHPTFWLFNSDAATAVNAATYANTALSTAPNLKKIFDSQDDTYRMAQALYLLDRETKPATFRFQKSPATRMNHLIPALKPRSETFSKEA